jgi:murein DD-endopeptidase MepM/ murein hydrolase activator NlpD
MVALLGAALLVGCADPEPRAPGRVADGPTAAPTTPAGPTPSPSAAAIGVAPTTAAPKPSTGPPPAEAKATGRYAYPVKGRSSYGRTHGGYPASDIFADCGTPVVAVTDGVVLEVSRVDDYSKSGPQGPDNGGLSVSLLGDDGVRYYGSHLSRVDSGIEAGVRVRAGQRVGLVGRTGNANNVCHLHFGISPQCAGVGDWWIRRGVIWPARYLDGWRAGKQTGAGAAVRSWRDANGCPKAP